MVIIKFDCQYNIMQRWISYLCILTMRVCMFVCMFSMCVSHQWYFIRTRRYHYLFRTLLLSHIQLSLMMPWLLLWALISQLATIILIVLLSTLLLITVRLILQSLFYYYHLVVALILIFQLPDRKPLFVSILTPIFVLHIFISLTYLHR